MKKITTKIDFKFNEQEEVPELNFIIKTLKKKKSIKIKTHTVKKRKAVDSSTKLF